MSETVRVSVYIDKELSDEADKIFSMLGLSSTTAISIFYNTIYKKKEIPINIDSENQGE